MFRQRNTGTHPNTHCCHAVLDVLFICWIPAQSRSHAFPRALSLPPNTPPPFLPPENAPVTHPHTRLQGPRLRAFPRRLLIFLTAGCLSGSFPPFFSPSTSLLLLSRLTSPRSSLFSPVFCLILLSRPSPLTSLPLSRLLQSPLSLPLPGRPAPCLCSAALTCIRDHRARPAPLSTPGPLQPPGKPGLFTQPERAP